MIEPEMRSEMREQVIEPLAGLSRQATARKDSLFFRLARQRAEYFADIEGLQPEFEIDDLPTHRYSAFLQSIGLSLTPLGVLPIEEQPTRFIAAVEPPVQEELPPMLIEDALARLGCSLEDIQRLNLGDIQERHIEDNRQINFEDIQQLDFQNVPLSLANVRIDPSGSQAVEEAQEILEQARSEPESASAVQEIQSSAATQLSSLLKSSGVYALASLAVPLVGLALAPFLTHNLTRSDYGALAVLNTAIALMAGLSQLGLGSAFFRVYTYEYEATQERLRVLSTTLGLLLLCTIPLTVLAFLTAPWLARALLGNANLAADIQLAALAVLLQDLTVPGLAWMRAERRATMFALISIANLLVNLGMTLLLVGWCHLGIAGALFATGCGYGLMLLATLPRVFLHVGKFVLRLDIARALLSFGLPNALSFVAAWVLQLADRFLLAHMRSLSETATYSVAYTLGGALSVVVLSPFALAWPSTMFLLAKRTDAQHIFRLIFRWYSLGLLFIAYALSLASLFVLRVFFPVTYQNAAVVIPLVTLSTMFYGLYNYLTLGMNIRKKIWYAVLFITIAAALNIGANCILIPLYGSLGAAVATLIAYALLAVLTYLLNQRIYPVSFDIGLFGLGLGLTIICYLGGNLLAQGRPFWIYWGIMGAVLLLCGLTLFGLGKLWSAAGERQNDRRSLEDKEEKK
jgi:O-antigen/teichoic acid export membrane protein